MIIFKTLEYRNFLSTGDSPTKIVLNRDSATLVVGSNGAGKSTMLDALSFALFGKPHRNINKPQLINSINNKNCLVVVEFSIGPIEYRIVRGMKPNIFEIYRNGNLLNQESHSRDYQKILEQNILKLNHKSFHQVVVLGSSNFIPFMQLPSNQRRNVIEDLLDIGIFTKMNTLLKDKYSLLKNQISDTNHQIELLKQSISLQTNHLADLKMIDVSNKEKKQKEINDINEEIIDIENSNISLQEEYDKTFNNVNNSYNKVQRSKQDLLIEKNSLKKEMDSIVKESMFYDTNNTCPTCAQVIDSLFKEQKHTECKNKAKSLSDHKEYIDNYYNKLEQESNELHSRLVHLNEVNSSIRQNVVKINELKKRIDSLNKDIVVKDTTEAENKLNEDRKKRDELLNLKDEQSKLSSYFDAINELLRDTGIKTKVIRQYLPIMNKLINQYLQILDFFVLFNLDEAFNETIKSRHRDEFSYSSFSEGEKQRIDLSLLFAWRQIAKMKNSANTNLLILDETFDSSMDADGVDNLLKILYTLGKETNVFIISHKQDQLDGKFPKKLEFEKINNFSQLKTAI